MKRVITIGNALLDSLITTPDDSIISQFGYSKGSMSLVDVSTISQLIASATGLPSESSMGGSAGNCARAMANLGASVAYVGKVGCDEAGEEYDRQLTQLGIESRLFTTLSNATGQCLSLIANDGERTMITHLGAALDLSASEISKELFEGYDILFVEGYLVQSPELITKIFEVARQSDIEIAIDLASYNVVEESLPLIKSLIEGGVSIIFANEQEAEAFTGESDPMVAAEIISTMCDIAVVKVGSKGSITISGDEIVEVGATNHIRRDTTGAGDYFAAAFLKGYCSGESMVRSAQMGSIAGGAVIEVVGTSLSEEAWSAVRHDISRIVE